MTIVTFRHIISPYLHARQDLPIYLIPIITANDIHLNTSKRMHRQSQIHPFILQHHFALNFLWITMEQFSSTLALKSGEPQQYTVTTQ